MPRPMPTLAPPRPLRDQLRHATAAAHTALEATPLMQAVTQCVPSPAVYGAYLAGHWRVHAALEPLLADCLPPSWTAGRLDKAGWLLADLQALGATPGAAPVSAPRFDSQAEALGAMYVLEGATLGLGVVGRRLPAAHPARHGAGRFMAAYGGDTGARWKTFLQLLGTCEGGDGAATCASALRTFGLFQQIVSAFSQVANSFQYLVNSWPTIVELISIYKRLKAFESTLHDQPLSGIETEVMPPPGPPMATPA